MGRLGGLLREASERLRRLGRPVLASLTEPIPLADPVAVFGNAAALTRDRLLWLQPDSGFSLIGAGTAQVFESGGPQRFSETAAAWDALCSGALIESAPQAPVAGPFIMGGFSFDEENPAGTAWQGYPGGRMVLPRVCVSGTRGGSWLTLNAVLRPGVSAEQEAAEIVRLRGALTAAAAHRNGHTPPGRPSSFRASTGGPMARGGRGGDAGGAARRTPKGGPGPRGQPACRPPIRYRRGPAAARGGLSDLRDLRGRQWRALFSGRHSRAPAPSSQR